MSLSNPTVSQNPASKYIEYKGDSGKWFYFDKTKGENGENVELHPPLYFIVLDELATIKGWSDQYESGIYSNEVHHINETLRVKSFKGGLSIVGKYPDIKFEVKGAGGKYTKSIYAMLVDSEDNTELVNFQLRGIAFSTWLDLGLKQSDWAKKIIGIEKEVIEGKKGAVKYFIPTFKTYKMKDELLEQAMEMDKELQKYLSAYKTTKEHEQEESDPYEKVEEECADMERKIEEQEKRERGEEIQEEDEKDDLPF